MKRKYFLAVLIAFFIFSGDLKMNSRNLQINNEKISAEETSFNRTEKNETTDVLLNKKIENFNILWTDKDIVVSNQTNSQQLIFSTYAFKKAQDGMSKIKKVYPNYKDWEEVKIEFQIKSVLGSLVSFEVFYMSTARVGNKPVHNEQIIVVDFSKETALDDLDFSIKKALEFVDDNPNTKFPFSLTSYYSDKEIISALYNQPTIGLELKNHFETEPESLEVLFESQEWLKAGQDDHSNRYFFSKESLSNFEYDEMQDSQICFEMQLYPEANYQEMRTITVKLPINSRIGELLGKPTNLSAKFLKNLTNDKKTVLEYKL